MHTKKPLSILLTLALVLGLLPWTVMPARATDGEIWVNGVQVTSGNAADVLGNGTVSYAADTKTLTPHNASITQG